MPLSALERWSLTVCAAILAAAVVFPYLVFTASIDVLVAEEDLLRVLGVVSPLVSMVSVTFPLFGVLQKLRKLANPYRRLAATDADVQDGGVEIIASVAGRGGPAALDASGLGEQAAAPATAVGEESSLFARPRPSPLIKVSSSSSSLSGVSELFFEEEEAAALRSNPPKASRSNPNSKGSSKSNKSESHDGSADEVTFPTAVFKAQGVCNVLGVCYGIQVRSEAVLASNLVGLLFQLFFLAVAEQVSGSNGQRGKDFADGGDGDSVDGAQEEQEEGQGENELGDQDDQDDEFGFMPSGSERSIELAPIGKQRILSADVPNSGAAGGRIVPSAASSSMDASIEENAAATGINRPSVIRAMYVSKFVFSFSFNLMLTICLGVLVCNLLLLGVMIIFATITLAMAPLFDLGRVIRYPEKKVLDPIMCVIYMTVNGVWSLYGIILEDLVVLLPSLLSYVLCVFQFLVILWTYDYLTVVDMRFVLKLGGSGSRGSGDWRLCGGGRSGKYMYARSGSPYAYSGVMPDERMIRSSVQTVLRRTKRMRSQRGSGTSTPYV